MVSDWDAQRKSENPRYGKEVITGEYAEASREAMLVAEQRYPELEFIDPINHLGGEFVGYYLGLPYDWNVSDPYLMVCHEHDNVQEPL